MKKINYKLYILLFPVLMLGCKKDYLLDGKTTEGQITEEQVWANDGFARGVLFNAYSLLPDEYDLDDNGAMLASGSDEAVNSNQNSSVNVFNNGTWSAVRTFNDVYNTMYTGIRKANLFLENANGSAITPNNNEMPTDSLKEFDKTYQGQISRLRGEAFFLRAFFEFELVKRYGAIPLVTHVLGRDEELNLPRNSFEECVKQISDDCDSAMNVLPKTTKSWSDANKGRATKTAAMALKSRLLLYAASPLYNPAGDITKWQAAAAAAKSLIDLGLHSLYAADNNAYRNLFWFGTAPYNDEVIFATRANNRHDIEENNAPVSYDGARGRTNPTQELVDAFEMKTTGRMITDPASGYDPSNPYNNRDPRFDFAINRNGSTFKSVIVDTYIGGKDGIGQNINATKTGYYMRKFMNESVKWNQQTNTDSRRPWVLFRYAEILLNYAEALNEAGGSSTEVLKYVNMVRQRRNMLPALQTSNVNGNGYVAPTREALRERIHNERRVELCFEGHRFFDVRRWKEGERFFNKPVTGMRITKNENGSFSYERFQVENRVFEAKNYFYPFSRDNVNRQPALIQNSGY